jgi:hypothetical protein
MSGDGRGSRFGRVGRAGAREVSAASVVVFRVAFGLAMTVNVLLYLPELVHYYYVKPSFTFGYPPFDFIRPLPGPGVQLVYVAMGLLGLTIAAGLWYRASCAVFCVLTTYVFLLDSSYFQNHEYLISLLSFLMIFLPLHRRWSLDARRRPATASRTVPAWVVWLLRFQIGVPYVFGGIAKLNGDWLRGEPLRMWLAERTDIPVIGRFYTDEPVVCVMTYGSLLFDLLVVWFLLYRRTRPFAYAVALCFHLLNVRMFGLYVFPWLMMAASLLFFPPNWPEQLRRRLRRLGAKEAADPASGDAGAGTAEADTAGGGGTGTGTGTGTGIKADPGVRPAGVAMRPVLVALLACWAVVQIVLPFRHLAIPGDANWTEEGHRFAWHMMLRTKSSSAGFVLTDGERTWRIANADYLTPKQEAGMAGNPERIVLFARHLSKLHDGAEVRVNSWVRLNGRERARLIDPTVDLSRVSPFWLGHADWILPLEEPLRR